MPKASTKQSQASSQPQLQNPVLSPSPDGIEAPKNGALPPKTEVKTVKHVFTTEERSKFGDELALTEPNTEIRREIVRKVGLERFVQAAGARVMDKLGNYELISVRLSEEAPDCRYLKMLNPSIGVWHVEGVGPDCRTVREALHFRKPDALRSIPVSDNGDDWSQQGDVCIWPINAKSVKPMPAKLT